MSINIDLQGDPDAGNQPPDRRSGILSILLAVLLFVSAVVVLLVARQRTRQADLLPPTPTIASRVVTPPATLTVAAQQTVAPGASATVTAQRPAAATGTVAVAPPLSPTRSSVPGSATAAPTSPAAPAQPTSTAPALAPTQTARPAAPTAPPPPVSPSPVVSADGRTWYFGEGATVSPFRTFYTVYNPGSQPVTVTVDLYPETGKSVQRTLTVAAGAQARVQASELLPNAALSAKISSDRPVYVERLTIGDRDGTASTGMTPATTWYFPEAQTDEDFTTWLVVLNPNASPAAITVNYYPVGGKAVTKTYSAPPSARLTIAAQKDVPSGVMSIVLQSSLPVVAEHAIYFDNQKAAYGGPGLSALSKTWYVSSGNTQVNFTARLALFNPNKEPAMVKVTLIGSKQAAVTDTYAVDPMSKDDIVLNDRADEQFVSVIVESDRPIAAQTVTYYLSGTEAAPVAAYSASALPSAATQWYLPDITANNDFDPYVMLFNPGKTAASVTVTYAVQGAEAASKTYDLAAQGRATLRVSDEVKGKAVVAASVKSTQPIVVERMSMFRTSVGAAATAGTPGQ